MLSSLFLTRRPRGFAWLVALWLGVTSSGLAMAQHYAGDPGKAASAPTSWPVASSLARFQGGATLVVTLHPRCPCSRATVRELDRLMANARGRLRAFVLIVVPEGLNEPWAEADLPSLAARIPGVEIVADPEGREAARFSAETSGQAVLYDASGALRFAGGITPARGHEGASVGQAAILDVIEGRGAAVPKAAVFGCSLF